MDKRNFIKELVLEKDTSCFRTFYHFFSELLEDARERNDTAMKEEVYKIQGEIRLLKYLLKELNPSPIKRKHYDGGFGG